MRYRSKPILQCYVGSKAHNLYVPPQDNAEFGTCDIDTFEIFVYDKQYYLGTAGYNHYQETIQTMEGEFDMVKHELRKAYSLLMKGNPNVLVTLFNEPRSYQKLTDGARLLVENRHKFLCTPNVYNRFLGFAWSQFTKMNKNEFLGYMGQKRKAIVEKYGYDTKNAMTLMRLLHEGIELMTTGNVTIYKTGAEREWLLGIKQAKYSFEEIKDMAESQMAQFEQAKKHSVLPERLDYEFLDYLLRQLLEMEVFYSHD